MSTEKQRILVPLDGSLEAEAALKAVVPLVKAGAVGLELLMAHEENDRASVYLDGISRGLMLQGIPSDIHLRTGRAAEVILSVAGESGVDLIAMSTHGRSGLSRMIAGSVTEEVLRRTNIPMLVCRPGTGLQVWESIVVALDGSRSAEEVIPEAGRLARALSLTVDVVKAVEPVATIGGFSGAGYLSAEDPMPYLEEACGRLRSEGVYARAVGLTGRAPSEIVRYAIKSGAGLICMTTHGWTGLLRLLLGSVAEEVLRNAPCAVLVRRTKEAPRPVEWHATHM